MKFLRKSGAYQKFSFSPMSTIHFILGVKHEALLVPKGFGCDPYFLLVREIQEPTMGQNRKKKHRINSPLINHSPTSSGVSKVSERASQ